MKLYLTALITLLLAFSAGCLNQSTEPGSKPESGDAKTENTEKTETKDETAPAGQKSPTETMKTFLEGMKNKDVKAVRASISKASLDQMEQIAELKNQSLEEFINSDENNTMKQMLEMRNEKIDGDTATLEVKDADTGKWETVPFVKEEGAWKIAFDKMS